MPDEYISREEAIHAIMSAMPGGVIPTYETVKAVNAVGAIPAADVSRVVRCKDCEQYVAGELGYGKCNFFKTAIFSEFYCRYGGKKGRAE